MKKKSLNQLKTLKIISVRSMRDKTGGGLLIQSVKHHLWTFKDII